jgi:uncharacterized protein YecE (DUF72 family)
VRPRGRQVRLPPGVRSVLLTSAEESARLSRRAGRPSQRAARLYVGTSGFAYPDWAPRFYPPGLRGDALLPHYASRFLTCELNNTFYARPTPQKIDAWVAATPPEFRFAIKAQRGGSMRALLQDPGASVPWLTEPLPHFGERLGTVLFRVPKVVKLRLERLDALLADWPSSVPLTMEFQDPSWHIDEVFARLKAAGVVLCATELPDDSEPPLIRLTGPFLYLRLRRHDYTPADIEAWATRLDPFLADGLPAYVYFRHDETGRATELAAQLEEAVNLPEGRR